MVSNCRQNFFPLIEYDYANQVQKRARVFLYPRRAAFLAMFCVAVISANRIHSHTRTFASAANQSRARYKLLSVLVLLYFNPNWMLFLFSLIIAGMRLESFTKNANSKNVSAQ
jgi:hypothetical protein